MANTKSAERRMRSNARRNERNTASKRRLKTLEKRYASLLEAGKKDEATKALREVHAAFDKAAKHGVVHKSQANRKKSRLTVALAAAK